MRALAIVMLLVSVTHADGLRTTPIGFDHLSHDRKLVTSAADSIPCVSCHELRGGRLVGTLGHATCFGTCHGAAPVRPRRGVKLVVDPEHSRLCTACHSEAALSAPFSGKLPVAYPPYAIDPDFGLTIGHKQHREVACTQCHVEPGMKAARPAPHQRCAACHDGSGSPGRGPAMSACGGCHRPAVGTPQPPELAAVHNSVTSAFSHGKHAARGGPGKDCATCHAAIRATDDTELPRPTVTQCATSGCHDGHAAFATTVACTRCHDRAPTERFEVARPDKRFVHGGNHAQLLANRPCGACHPVGGKGEVLVAGHDACTSCHAADFAERKPLICGACHNATEPWRPLVADRAPPDRTEFGATLDHAKHVGVCTSCHMLRTQTTQLRTPRGHASCTTAGCHAITGGPAPQLGTCDGCHELGLVAARLAKRSEAPWSVRAAFDHAPHHSTCTECHVDLTGASVVDLPAPPKRTCAPCHDGQAAFKLTGTTCTRCHAGAKS